MNKLFNKMLRYEQFSFLSSLKYFLKSVKFKIFNKCNFICRLSFFFAFYFIFLHFFHIPSSFLAPPGGATFKITAVGNGFCSNQNRSIKVICVLVVHLYVKSSYPEPDFVLRLQTLHHPTLWAPCERQQTCLQRGGGWHTCLHKQVWSWIHS